MTQNPFLGLIEAGRFTPGTIEPQARSGAMGSFLDVIFDYRWEGDAEQTAEFQNDGASKLL